MTIRTTDQAIQIHLAKLGVTAALLLAAGCGGGGSDVAIACAEQGIETHNSMGYNSMGYNALAYNGVQITEERLHDIAIDDSEPCQTRPTLQFMEYLVGCALGDDQGITVRLGGTDHELRGQLGLAPEWAEAPCDESCQGWVSACLIARINARGERVEISMRGSHPALALEPGEAEAFPHLEADYYGNLFTDPVQLTACLPAGNTELDRVCGELEDCPVEVAGGCEALCDESGCQDAAGRLHPEVVQVFRDVPTGASASPSRQ